LTLAYSRDGEGELMAESETQLQQTKHLVSVRLLPDQYQSLARDSAALGMSLADVVRQRLYNSAPLTKENKEDHRG
jgi:hypothetical protein